MAGLGCCTGDQPQGIGRSGRPDGSISEQGAARGMTENRSGNSKELRKEEDGTHGQKGRVCRQGAPAARTGTYGTHLGFVRLHQVGYGRRRRL